MDRRSRDATLITQLLVSLIVLVPVTHGFHLLCYWTVWSQGRTGDYALKPGDIDPYLCTHLIYAFGVVGPNLEVDLELTKYPDAETSVRALNNLKTVNENLITLVSIGGASKGPEAFTSAAESEQSRRAFAANVVSFCRQWRFDGIDIDWEYPKDKTKFTLLVQAVRKAFDEELRIENQKRLVVTAAVSVAGEKISALYDIPALNKALDYFNVMAYDFHGSWGKVAAFNSPLYSRRSNPEFQQTLSANWAVEEYIVGGASESKIILGLASYGRAYELTDRTLHDVGAPIKASTTKGHVLGEVEFRMLPEVCHFINTKRARYFYDEEQQSAFVYTIDFWIGYDDTQAFKVKTEYAINRKLGGVLIWTLDYDDVSGNHCNLGVFPLTNAVKKTIEGQTSTIPQKPLPLYRPTLDLPKPEPNTATFKRLCYFTNWSTKRSPEMGQFSLDYIDLDRCTHLVYSYAFVDEVGMGVLPIYDNEESISDRQDDIGMFELFNGKKRYKPSLRTILSIGGETAGIRPFDLVSQDEASARKFATNVVDYLVIWGFDGVEIAWIYPGTPARTKSQFTFLLQTLRGVIDQYNTENNAHLMVFISAASEANEIQAGYEIGQISNYVDFINVRSHTYTRTDNVTYFGAPLRESRTDSSTAQLNQEWSINRWISGGAPAAKLMLGLTGMGRSFTLRQKNMTTPGSPVIDSNVPGTILGLKGLMTHSEICDFLNREAKEVFDPEQVAAYAFLNDIWVGYESRISVKQKMNWLVTKGLGGFTFWSLDYDDFIGNHCRCGRMPLLSAAYQALTRQPVLCSTSTTTSHMIPVRTTEPGSVIVDGSRASVATVSIPLLLIISLVLLQRPTAI